MALELIATASHESISPDSLEDLRFFITLRNKYPVIVKSVRYLSFLECNVKRNGFHFHTVDSPVKRPQKILTDQWSEVFPSDTSITVTIYVDINQICNKKGIKNSKGFYTVEGIYYNDLINDDSEIPVWIGSAHSNLCSVEVN